MRTQGEIQAAIAYFAYMAARAQAAADSAPANSDWQQQALLEALQYQGARQALRWAVGELVQLEFPDGGALERSSGA
jgi:hypothetical protein